MKRLENILGSSNTEVQQFGRMDFSALFINEYTHYGDAIDGYDLIKDNNGNLINSTDHKEPCEPYCNFDEGNDAANELFPLETGRQNYFLYKNGQYISQSKNEVLGTDESKRDKTMIPPDGEK